MKKILSIICTILFCFSGLEGIQAQYYYKDILSQRQGLQKYRLLKQHRVSQIKVLSFEGNGEPSEGFAFEQTLNPTYSQSKTRMATSFSGKMSLQSNYSNGLLNRTVDSGYMTYSAFSYSYDSLQRIVRIDQVSQGIGEQFRSSETHHWTYNADGSPETMIKVKEGRDSGMVQFEKDENGRIVEEYTVQNGIRGEKTYYYYNPEGLLTDIVRYNQRAKQLVADYMFDYYPDGQIRQMTTLDPGSLDQGTWIYIYNEKGLTSEEKFYNAQKKLAGRMVYQYEFRK